MQPRLGALVALFAVAAAARLAVALATPLSTPVSDMAEYWERALYIWQHGALYPNSWRMPGLPVSLAAVFAATDGPTLVASRILNVAVGAVSAVLTSWFAWRTGASQRASLAAGLVVAIYPTLLVYTTLVTSEGLVVAPLMAALVASTYASRWARVLLGVLMGATVLVRPAGIVLAAAVLPGLARRGGGTVRRRLLDLGCVALGGLVALGPWWLHGAAVHHRIIPLDTTGGLNLLIGNGPGATGTWTFAHVTALQATVLRGVDVTTPDGADRATSLALDAVAADPLAAIGRLPKKAAGVLALEGREHAYLYSIGYFGDLAPGVVRTWGLAVMASFPLLFTAAVLGIAGRPGPAAPPVDPTVPLFAWSLAMHLVTFGDPRFHVPLVPVLAVCAVHAPSALRHLASRRVALAAAIVLALVPGWWRQGRAYQTALGQLVTPGGAHRVVSFDDLAP